MPSTTLTAASALPALADRVEERTVGPCRLLVLPTPVQEIVSWKGSFLTYPDFAVGDELIQAVTVGLLDKGTRRHDRFAIAEILENRGAQLSFASEGLMVGMQGRALRDHVPNVLAVMGEQLREPVLDPTEFEKMRMQYRAALQRSLEDTGTQADAALSRRLYDPGHPNYTAPTLETLRRLDALTVDDVRAYHKDHFGGVEVILVLVGDVDADSAEEALRQVLGDWGGHDAQPAFSSKAEPEAPGRTDVYMPGKVNIDVRIGQELEVLRQDEDYMPLYVANFALGGNFSSRLMTIVRDEKGLTYGIRSELSGVTTRYAGHWQVRVTLSQDRLDEGTEATMAEVERFVEEGPSREELERVKTTITGSFKVGLATTGGLATALHMNARRGFDVGYLDRFPAEVEGVTLEQVREAVQRHLRPDDVQFAAAGMLPERPDGQGS